MTFFWWVEAIVAALSNPRDVIEDIDPYLLYQGLIQRIARGGEF